MNSESSDTFYLRLKEQLKATSNWPADYLYKFIVPTEGEKVKEVSSVFEKSKADIALRASKTGKYTSISIKARMINAEHVIEKYKEVGKIKGVISL
ncbi:MAG: DUF493 family protein [Cellulophaga sp.]